MKSAVMLYVSWAFAAFAFISIFFGLLFWPSIGPGVWSGAVEAALALLFFGLSEWMREPPWSSIKTVADPDVLWPLVHRLEALGADSQRRWGTLTPHEMLCHLGDAAEMVLMTRPRTVPMPPRRRTLVKVVILWMPFPWRQGVKTNPRHDPRVDGTRPSDFERDRARAIASLQDIAAATSSLELEPVHGILGNMTYRDWQRWAYRHTDYHLRQFGL